MTSNAARISAIVSAILTLTCVAFWLFNGAPNVPHLNLLIDPATDAARRPGDVSVIWLMIWGLASTSPLSAHAALFVLAATVVTAAVLCLLLLLRATPSDAVRILGTGLGWWSLCVGYQALFSVVPVFGWFERFPLGLRVACDVVCFQMLLAAAIAFVRFWSKYPRLVPDEELAAFIDATRRKGLGSTRDEGVHPFAHRIWISVRNRQRLWLGFAVIVVLGESLLWRAYAYMSDNAALGTLEEYAGIFVSLGSIFVFGSLVLHALRLFRYHRAIGDAEERRKVEWISAALWVAVVLFLLPAAVTPLLYLAEHWYPDLAFERGWIGIYLLVTLISAPLIVLIALALSIFYRGTIDPRLALRSVTVWTILGMVLTLVFVFVERSVAQDVVALFHLPPQTSLVSASAIVAATFQPIRKQSEAVVNRFVEGVLPTTMLASGKRRVAAVAIVDISGYTALSEKDEQSALVASTLVQKEARRVADDLGGRVVKSTGDGVIMVFESAQKSLGAVKGLHVAVTKGGSVLSLGDLKLHSALHWGEIVEMHDGDIYGQTVNITARIADWAKAGEIGVSHIFSEQLSPGAEDFEVAGPQTFKNVQQPIACMKLIAG